METLLVAAALAAVVKFVDLISKKDFTSALKIVVAVVAGALAGFVGLQNLTIETGIYAGLVASGVIAGGANIASKVSGVIR